MVLAFWKFKGGNRITCRLSSLEHFTEEGMGGPKCGCLGGSGELFEGELWEALGKL